MSMLAEQSSTLGLSQLAAAIKDAIAAGDAAAQKSVEHYATAGKHLIKVKEMLPHGEWESWVMVNADKSLSTCRGYMRLAKLDRANRQRVADMSLRQALEEIAEPLKAPPSPSTQGNCETSCEEATMIRPPPQSCPAESAQEEPTSIRSERAQPTENEPINFAEVAERQIANELADDVRRIMRHSRRAEPERVPEALKAAGVSAADLEELAAWATDMATRLARTDATSLLIPR